MTDLVDRLLDLHYRIYAPDANLDPEDTIDEYQSIKAQLKQNQKIVERFDEKIEHLKYKMKEYRTADVYWDYKEQKELLKSIRGKKCQ